MLTYRMRRNHGLDPVTDYREITRNVAIYEFPWDFFQSLSFALYRTYAVPSIGRLLDETRQFHDHTQKRYDDTALLLEPPLVQGFDSVDGRAAIRRINQMHAMYDISNDDMRYVLSTFVVVPKRWLDDYGWRKLTPAEIEASVLFYGDLGRHMAIKDIPTSYAEFERLMDSYEAEHFRPDPATRRVADSLMDLMCSFHPAPLRGVVELFSRSIMDDPLLDAFGYPHPPRLVRALSRGALRLRGRFVALLPSRRKPTFVADRREIRSYPGGFQIAALGTFAELAGKRS